MMKIAKNTGRIVERGVNAAHAADAPEIDKSILYRNPGEKWMTLSIWNAVAIGRFLRLSAWG